MREQFITIPYPKREIEVPGFPRVLKVFEVVRLLRELAWVRRTTIQAADTEEHVINDKEQATDDEPLGNQVGTILYVPFENYRFQQALATMINNHTPMERTCMSDD